MHQATKLDVANITRASKWRTVKLKMYLNYFSISRKRHVEIEGHVSFFTKENTKENFYIWSRYCWEIFSSLSKIEQTKGDGELSVFRSDLPVSPSVCLSICLTAVGFLTGLPVQGKYPVKEKCLRVDTESAQQHLCSGLLLFRHRIFDVTHTLTHTHSHPYTFTNTDLYTHTYIHIYKHTYIYLPI